jgi:hypothetical protein
MNRGATARADRDAWFETCKAEAVAIPVASLIERLGIAGLRQVSGEMVGPCPLCGGRDRFAIKLSNCYFLCRQCGIKGMDQITLVREVLSLGYADALGWLCGDMPAEIDPAEMERRRKKAKASQKRQDEYAEKARKRARRDARDIWRRSVPALGTDVVGYLERRGITKSLLGDLPPVLRFLPDHPYVKRIGGQTVTAHRGPAMIAIIQRADGRGSAVHQTWLDLDQIKGKAEIVHKGDRLDAKLVRGSKKGGAIRLLTPTDPQTLIMGEGIETTLSALVAAPVPRAAYWAGVDLGNMSGRMRRIEGVKHSGIPDMTDSEAFVPPPWVKRLIFIMDGDSAPKMTRAKLESGLKRAMACRPGLVGQIVQAGKGVDLNDVLMGVMP